MKRDLSEPQMPTLTVGLPAYNAAASIEAALLSVLQQSWRGSMEILVVDDGSTDDTVAIATRIADAFGAVRVVRHDANYGRPTARNTILREARGTFLTWIDADDKWYPNKLAVQFDALLSEPGALEGEPVICMCPFDWQWSHSRKAQHRVPNIAGDQLRGFLNGRIGAYLWTMLGKTQTFRNVGEFDTELPRLQDLDFLIRFCAAGGRLTMTAPEMPLCIYLKSDEDKPGRVIASSLARIWSKHRPLFRQYGPSFVRGCRKNHLILASRHASKNEGKPLGAWYYLRAAVFTPKILFKRPELPETAKEAPRPVRLDPAPYIARPRGREGLPQIDVILSLQGEHHEELKRYFSRWGEPMRAAGLWFVPPRLGCLKSSRDHFSLLKLPEPGDTSGVEARRRMYEAAIVSNSDGHSSVFYLGAPVPLDLGTPTDLATAVEQLVPALASIARDIRATGRGVRVRLHLLCPDTETLLWQRFTAALESEGHIEFEDWLQGLDAEAARVLDHRVLLPLTNGGLGYDDVQVHVLGEGSMLRPLMAKLIGGPDEAVEALLPPSEVRLAEPSRNQAAIRGFEALAYCSASIAPAFALKARQGLRRIPRTSTPLPPSPTVVGWMREHCELIAYEQRFGNATAVLHGAEGVPIRTRADDIVYPIASDEDFERFRSEMQALAAVAASIA